MKWTVLCFSLVAGCGLFDSSGLHIGYTFDKEESMVKLGNESSPYTLPSIPCAAGANPDPCEAANSALPPPSDSSAVNPKVTCDPTTSTCEAVAEIRLLQKIDLRNAMTGLPDEAITVGINAVSIDKIAYWAQTNTFNFATPPIDLYVASMSASSEADPTAVLLGTVASLPAKSRICGDTKDTTDPAATGGQTVCDLKLTSKGQTALAQFIQSFRSAPFQLIIHAQVTAAAGSPIPAGTLDLFVRPSVTLTILK